MKENKIKYEGKETSPDNYGKAFKEKYESGVPKRQQLDEEEIAVKDATLDLFKIGVARKRSQWTDEAFLEAVTEYFEYITLHCIKPSKAGLTLWLGANPDTYREWTLRKEKYGFKSEVLNFANLFIENSYINRGEKFPTFNMFLLKATSGYIEQNKVEVVNSNKEVTADEVKDMVAKLGLDKK